MSGSGTLAEERQETEVPVMVQLGTEDTVIGEAGNEAGRRYVQTHNGPAYCVEVARGGHVSFTSGTHRTPCNTVQMRYHERTSSYCTCMTTTSRTTNDPRRPVQPRVRQRNWLQLREPDQAGYVGYRPPPDRHRLGSVSSLFAHHRCHCNRHHHHQDHQ